ncbi:MAG: hypothetical protein JSS83_28955 [Cyanobacteria bacterium SZAS LIN-3]|nr:hypothetical protein [Cyanobacteria bacterium SZAS LIN-3]
MSEESIRRKKKPKVKKPEQFKVKPVAKKLQGKDGKKTESLTPKAAEKLKEGSEIRRQIPKTPKSKRPKSEAEKRSDKRLTDSKREGIKKHLAEKAAHRESISKQKAGLQKELAALNKLAQVRETVDSQYTVKFGAADSAIAAGPRGATSGGLRKLTPAIAINLLRQEGAQKLQAKLDPKVQQAMAKIGKLVRDLKLTNLKDMAVGKAVPQGSAIAGKDAQMAEAKIVNSRLRAKIRETKEKEISRDPNRDASKWSEVNMPFRGMG